MTLIAKSKAKSVLTLSQLLKDNPDALRTKHAPRTVIKKPVPRHDDSPIMRRSSDIDFVDKNARDVIDAEPKTRAESEVDYLTKKEYGKIPSYIKRINKDVEEEKAYMDRVRRESEADERAKKRLLAEDERVALTRSLKEKWNQVNAKYQQKSHLTVLDTLHKLRRKETLEVEMRQLEADIAVLTQPGDIYVDLVN